jgi:hypothetical protein
MVTLNVKLDTSKCSALIEQVQSLLDKMKHLQIELCELGLSVDIGVTAEASEKFMESVEKSIEFEYQNQA